MLSDLFSQFDPSVSVIFEYSFFLFWAGSYMFIFLITLPGVYINCFGVLSFFRGGLKSIFSMCVEFGMGVFQGMASVLATIFFFIFSINLFGLFPATFSVSSHFMYTMSLGIPLWLAMLVMTYSKSPISKYGGYIGTGIPSSLGPMIGLCEIVSTLVRPLALGLRLGANMLAGHAILALVTNCLSYSLVYGGGLSVFTFSVISFGFFLFEMAVCVIQAYVFVLLLRIYVGEYPL